MSGLRPLPRRPFNWRLALTRILLLLSLAAVLVGGLVLAGAVVAYSVIAAQLPPAEELRSRSYHFATTVILDREGNLLWEIIDPTGGRRTHVTLAQVTPDLINATVATEDRFFYLNVGVDPVAIVRAVYSNVSEGEIVSGASTITQQLARNVFLSPEERLQKTFARKLKEAVLAIEISWRYSKNRILETYLNQTYYGNLAYGIEAASQTYFGKSAGDLTLAEAAMLAGLPQSPALYDPYLYPDRAKARQAEVLRLMVEAGYISQAEADTARSAGLALRDANFNLEAPHFVSLVRQELERNIPAAYLYQAGLRVQTTLDPRLQAIAEEEVLAQVTALAGRRVTNGALVALDVATGQVLAMVGSSDFRNEAIDGQVNVAITPRQPGSTMKPLTYLAAFERLGWTPSTLLLDTPLAYPDGEGNVYRPANADGRFHGPVSLRVALASSYNVPAVRTQEQLGLGPVKELAARLGITTLTRDDYGLSLTLGSGEVSLLEMTGAYQALANGGVLVPPTAILRITDSFGRDIQPVRPWPRPAVRPEHAYLITHILADNEARTPGFGPDSPLLLSRPAAAKTGTTNDFRDNWIIGYTPQLVAGVWVGNADNAPMLDVGGASGAGPIWHNFMERSHEGLPVLDFARPPGIVELTVCADSGTRPSEVCPETRQEVFFREQPPPGPEHDIHRLVEIDLNSGLLANEYCRSNIQRRYFRVYPAGGREWALSQGIEQPPTQYCPSAHLVARFNDPLPGSAVRGVIPLLGSAVAPRFAYYRLEIGAGARPQAFMPLQSPTTQWVRQGLLASLDTTQLPNGPHTLRLIVFDQMGGFTEAQTLLMIDNPPEAISIRTPVTTPPPTMTPTVPAGLPAVIMPSGTLTAPLAAAPGEAVAPPPPALLPGEMSSIQLFSPPEASPGAE